MTGAHRRRGGLCAVTLVAVSAGPDHGTGGRHGAWFGVSLLVMLSADVASIVTGDAHGLRRPIQAALIKLP